MKWSFWPTRGTAAPETCVGIEPLLPLYADGVTSPEEAHRLEAHLTGCGGCRESLSWLRATHRALAARPVVAPPADLHARIADAIAASSAAPVTLRPARVFRLSPPAARSAYAAAASLTALGLVFGYGELASGPHSARHPQAPPRVAAARPSAHALVASRPRVPEVGPRGLPLPARNPARPAAVASVNAGPDSPAQDRHTLVVVRKAPVVKARTATPGSDTVVAQATLPPRGIPPALVRPAPKPPVVASVKRVPAEHNLPVTLPDAPAPKITPAPLEASAAPPPAAVSVKIGAATVTPQEPARVRTASADSDLLGAVRIRVAKMQQAGYSPVRLPAGAQASFVTASFVYSPTYSPTK